MQADGCWRWGDSGKAH